MNPSDENLRTIDPAALDLLVDGELPEPHRRELLQRLDRMDGGWRSCAMAFLEAQCWKAEMRAAARQQNPEPPAAMPRRQRWFTNTRATVLAMAASFLVALGLGPLVHNAWFVSGGPSGADRVAAARPELSSEPTAHPQVAEVPVSPRPSQAKPASPWQLVTVALPDEQGRLSEAVQVPVRPEERLDESWLRPSPDVLPREVREALQRRGIQVRQSRELIPAPMDDGRRVVIPVDQVELHYVGNQGVQ